MTGFAQGDGQRHAGLRQQPLVLLGFVLLVSTAMVSRLVWLQVLEAPRFRQLADENRIRLVPRSPTRGRLLDRKGRVLASSKLTYSLYVEPRLVDDAVWPELRDRLARLLNLDAVDQGGCFPDQVFTIGFLASHLTNLSGMRTSRQRACFRASIQRE